MMKNFNFQAKMNENPYFREKMKTKSSVSEKIGLINFQVNGTQILK